MSVLVVRGGRALRGSAVVPGDKSISHRALMLAALADGPTRIERLSGCRDVSRTRACLERLGVPIRRADTEAVEVRGLGPRGLSGPPLTLDCGDSGTTMRLLAGLLAGQERTFTLRGGPGLCRRPMERVVGPLRTMGADVRTAAGRPPVSGRGGQLAGVTVDLELASAQVGSALLLAGLNARGVTVVRYPAPVRDHTERMLAHMGVDVQWSALETRLAGPVRRLAAPHGGVMAVPGDVSAAAFLLAAAAAVPGSEVEVAGLGLNPGRTGALEVLARMGARVEVRLSATVAGEPVGRVTVGADQLRSVDVAGSLVPRLVDELPLVAVLGSRAVGRTSVRGASELRVKESDRVAAMVEGLRRMGATITSRPDGFDVDGPCELRGARVSGWQDHRVVMALAVAGLAAEGETVVEDAERVADSFPGFVEALVSLGGQVTVRDEV